MDVIGMVKPDDIFSRDNEVIAEKLECKDIQDMRYFVPFPPITTSDY